MVRCMRSRLCQKMRVAITAADVFSDELEEFLGTMMDQEFDTLLEDGSLAEVCVCVCVCVYAC